MRPFNVKLIICCIGLIAGIVVAVMGCGSGGDLLDEVGTQYNAYAIPQENAKDVQEIDVVFRDCDDNATTSDSETNYPLNVKVVIETDKNAAPFYIERYDVNFRANHGTYLEMGDQYQDLTAAEMPSLSGTILNPVSYEYSSQVIQANSTVTLSGLLVWANGDKVYYLNNVLHNYALFGELVLITPGGYYFYEEDFADLVYDMQVTLHCVTGDDERFTITTPWTPIHFLDVDQCS